jgi:hypothetical protein
MSMHRMALKDRRKERVDSDPSTERSAPAALE